MCGFSEKNENKMYLMTSGKFGFDLIGGRPLQTLFFYSAITIHFGYTKVSTNRRPWLIRPPFLFPKGTSVQKQYCRIQTLLKRLVICGYSVAQGTLLLTLTLGDVCLLLYGRKSRDHRRLSP